MSSVTMSPDASIPFPNSVYSGHLLGHPRVGWAFSRLTNDSGGIDIFVLRADGEETRLTFVPGDDKPYSWSPDGAYLTITTARWDPQDIYEVGILEVRTGIVRRITNSEHLETNPLWSPDGTRLAYLRSLVDEQPSEICWTTTTGSLDECTNIPEHGLRNVVGWYDDREVLLVVDSAGRNLLSRFDLLTHDLRTLWDNATGSVRVSPDGEWFACYSRDPVSSTLQWTVHSLRDPADAKQVSFPDRAADDFSVFWSWPHVTEGYLDLVDIHQPPHLVPQDVPYYLRASGYDSQGRDIALHSLQWRSSDTATATVHSNGVVHPKRAGEVWISLSAGGWREDSTRLLFGPVESQAVFTEAWTTDWKSRWTTYEQPEPFVTLGPDSIPAFFNNGDAAFSSGAYTHSDWNVQNGLGLEGLLSTRVTGTGRQTMLLALTSWFDSTAIAAWDSRSGHIPGRDTNGGGRSCGVTAPDWTSVDHLLEAGGERKVVADSPSLASDAWYTVRLQIFPDGTCGLAINGRPVGRTTARIPLDLRYRVLTEGRSVGTQLLVGPLDVWTGVRTDVDWGAWEENR